MKTVGIIGGMGPEATNHVVIKVIKGFESAGQINRPSLLVDFVPVGIITESNLILNNQPGNFVDLLSNSAKRLQKGGADFLIIACNSVHLFTKEVRKSVNIPVISVLEEIRNLKLVDPGIIATDFTIKNKLFGNNLNLPSPEVQISINNIIDNLVKGHELNDFDILKVDELLNSWVHKGVKNCILGCSEMQLLGEVWNKWSKQIKFVDTMDILAKVAVNNLLN